MLIAYKYLSKLQLKPRKGQGARVQVVCRVDCIPALVADRLDHKCYSTRNAFLNV